jgi:hypothetical protein
MKPGKSLVQLAQELTRINENKKDFIVPTERLFASVPDGKLNLGFDNGTSHKFGLNSWSSSQLANYTDIPKAYFDRVAIENPALMADNINHGIEKIAKDSRKKGAPESRMIRTLDGNVRGMLSSRYRILDAFDMAETTLPVLQDKGMEVVSSEITDRRLFIKALSPKLTAEVKKGDIVQYGLLISTSDVGAGSVRVEPLLYRLACLNGLVMNTAIRKFHVGKNQAEEDIRELLSDKTRELTDQAFWHSVRDVIIGSMRPENFELQVDRLRVAANEEIKNFDLPRVVELTMKATGITGEGKKNSILAALASGNEGAGLTRWGLVNSFTRAAQAEDVSYEESIELERAGGAILELPKTQWSHIAAVA